jgi:hypothetical protein
MNPDAVLDEDQKKIRFRKLLLKQQQLWDNGRHDKFHLQDPGNYNDAEAKLDHDDTYNFVHDDGHQKSESKPADMEQQRQDSFQQSVPSFTQLVCSSYPIQTLDQIQNPSQCQKNNHDHSYTQNQNQKLKQVHSLTQHHIQNQNEELVPPRQLIEEGDDEDDDFLLKIKLIVRSYHMAMAQTKCQRSSELMAILEAIQGGATGINVSKRDVLFLFTKMSAFFTHFALLQR